MQRYDKKDIIFVIEYLFLNYAANLKYDDYEADLIHIIYAFRYLRPRREPVLIREKPRRNKVCLSLDYNEFMFQ